MNHEETRFAAKVMAAWADGKTVQARDRHADNLWFDCGSTEDYSMSWLWSEMDYRIKPEPRVIYVNEYEGGLGDAHYLEEGRGERFSKSPNYKGTRKFVEVME